MNSRRPFKPNLPSIPKPSKPLSPMRLRRTFVFSNLPDPAIRLIASTKPHQLLLTIPSSFPNSKTFSTLWIDCWPVAKKKDNICCNHVVVLNFVPNVSSISKDKSVYIPPHKRNQKVERKALKPKSLFRSHPRELCGSKQGFETRTGPYGPTGKTVNLLQSRFYKLKNRSMPKKQEAVRTAVQPHGSENRDQTVSHGSLWIWTLKKKKKKKNRKTK